MSKSNKLKLNKSNLIKFFKDWTLVLAILAGIGGYYAYAAIPQLNTTHHAARQAVAVIQPCLIFAMLLLTFTRIDTRSLRLRRWHAWILLLQCVSFVAIGCFLMHLPQGSLRIVLEGAMICLICPTATAAAVITRKLGGNVSDITTYTVLINIAAALLIPLLVPLVHPAPGVTMWRAAVMILAKVFPLLLMPLAVALLLKRFAPGVCRWLSGFQELSFYLWAIALSLAIAVTTHSLMHCNLDTSTLLWLVAVSAASCALQFLLGRRIGRRYGDHITAGQAFGQKNTVLAIWVGYTFFTPVTAVVGGFYSIWHNVVNSWQLYRHNHPSKQPLDHPSKH